MLLGAQRSWTPWRQPQSTQAESTALTAWLLVTAYLQVFACSCSSCCELNVLPQRLHLYSAMVFPSFAYADRFTLISYLLADPFGLAQLVLRCERQ
jgi:hypothetical protein